MDQRQLEELARDIEDLKRSVKRNSPILHEAFDMKGWDLFSLIAGILILIMPRLLNYIVAIYLIVIGLLGLFGGHLR